MSIDTRQLRSDGAPYLEQYFGLWAMHQEHFMLAYEHARRMNLSVHVKQQKQKKKDRLAAAAAQSASIVCASGGGGLPGYGYQLTAGGVAIVELVGTMMKQETSLGTSTSTVKLRRTIRALADPSIKGVLIVGDSPGGSSAGTGVLADDIAALAALKPVHFYGEDGIVASACYWAASQCSFISCDPRALIGSIGTYAVLQDSSRAAANEGVKVLLIKAGKLKGTGVPGTEITEEQQAFWQRIVDETNAHFISAVSRGRGMAPEKIAALDADVFMGEKAKAAGLVDAVESFDDALARLENMSPAGPVQAPTLKPSSKPNSKPKSEDVPPAMSSSDPAQSAPAAAESAELLEPIASAENKGDDMSQAQSAPAAVAGAPVSPPPAAASAAPASAAASNEPKPATLAELEAAFADDLPFAFGCAKLALTVQEAKASYADKLKAENAKLREQNAAANQAAAAAAAAPIVKRPGVPALPAAAIDPAGGRAAGQRGAGSGEARERFDELVAEQRKSGKSRQQAVASVAKQNPDLHLQMLQEANPDRVLDRALLSTQR